MNCQKNDLVRMKKFAILIQKEHHVNVLWYDSASSLLNEGEIMYHLFLFSSGRNR